MGRTVTKVCDEKMRARGRFRKRKKDVFRAIWTASKKIKKADSILHKNFRFFMDISLNTFECVKVEKTNCKLKYLKFKKLLKVVQFALKSRVDRIIVKRKISKVRSY